MDKQLSNRQRRFIAAGQCGQPSPHRLVQIDAPLIDQFGHGQRGGQGLGQRCQVEHGFFGHGLARKQVGLAIGLEKKSYITLAH